MKRTTVKEKIAVDTNVLVRYLTWDDEKHAEVAADILESAGTIFVSKIVLCELVWVLRRSYGLASDQVEKAIRQLMLTRSLDFDRAAAEAGLRLLLKGGDFADGVVAFEARAARCSRLVTFDKRLARDGDLLTVTLLP